MTVAFILLSALCGAALLLWLFDGRKRRADAPEDVGEPADGNEEGCCGMHITCERDSLLAAVSENIEYYDDEELDRFAGREVDAYAEEEIEEFRDILLSMRPDDIAGWARSLQLRGIRLPEAVREELIMIVAEERSARAYSKNVQIS